MPDEAHDAWERNAAFWDDYVGPEGNALHRELVSPSQMRLLSLKQGERVLDIACGNGQFAREMAKAGTNVVAFDFAETFIERAKQHTEAEGISGMEYRAVDATDGGVLRALGDHEFDAAVCTMALMDIATIEPLLAALPALLRPAGRFVFSVQHPCFNSNGCRMVAEEEVVDGQLVTRHGVQVNAYLDLPAGPGVGIVGQPEPHYYFYRSLSELLGACSAAGFLMDGIDEPAFPPDGSADRRLRWQNYSQIPPVLVARTRVARLARRAS